MEIFITLTKYYTRQRRGEGKPLLMEYSLISILISLTIVSNVSIKNENTH